jgi:hypothetical protein
MTPKAIFNELFGLFVDDGSLAINLLVWTAVAAVVLPRLPLGDGWPAILLLAGYLIILIENVVRAARNHRAG